MQKVIIKCFSNYSLINKYHIIIFDKYNKTVFDEYTKYNKTELLLNKDVYKIIIIPSNMDLCILSTNFIVKNKTNYLNFFHKANENLLKITAILVDKNYKNLLVERGEIKLWQNHIQ